MNTATDLAARIMVDQHNIQQQRTRAVKTAWALAVIAGLIFISFILSGVLNS